MSAALPAFKIPQAQFEGPLELLLELIERRKLLINDVSLVQVTDDYIAVVRELQTHPIAETADFVLVASTLLLIKSKSLLPIFDLTDNETGDIKDLEHRLKLYQLFRDIAVTIQKDFGVRVMYERSFIPTRDPIFLPDAFTTLPILTNAIKSIISTLAVKPFKAEARVQKVISLEEMITTLEDRILKQVKMRFSDLIKNDPDHKTKIVSFLAVLELVKQGFVSVRQEGRFDEIHIEKDGVSIPRYH